MKKHITVVCGVFFPEPSPTGLCAKRFIELLDEKYDIDVICISPDGTNKIVKDESGHTVYMLTGYRQGKEDRAKGLKKSIWHQLGRIEIKSFILGNLNWYSKAVYKCLKSIHKQNRIDTVFSICSPFAAHVGTHRFKIDNSEVKWCAYTVDPYSTSNRIRPLWCTLKALVRYEQRILENVDHLLLSDEVYSTRPDLIGNYNETEALPYILPDFEYKYDGMRFFNSEEINCVYAGRFYEDIRNPELMLQTFARMVNPQIKLHLFSVGCESIVHKYASQTDRIILHNLVSHDQILNVYGEADVLIMIANTTEEFLPSKTFEYIATGKPIVCFNARKSDPVFSNYPHVFIVNKTKGSMLEDFITNIDGNIVSREDIEAAYPRHKKENVKMILQNAVL